MRSFIGLDIAAKNKLDIEDWRHKALPSMPKAVPAANFHITLAFLGQIDLRQQETLIERLDGVCGRPFKVTLDTLGWFAKPEVLWLGCKTVPQALNDLAGEAVSAARSSGITVQTRKYVPHVTLARKITHAPPALFDPNIECRFTQFHLFESVSGETGVHYPIRQSWSLDN